jgi:hypothetical protein
MNSLPSTVLLAASLLLLLPSLATAHPQIVCSGKAAGGYAAFPDIGFKGHCPYFLRHRSASSFLPQTASYFIALVQG